MWGGLLKTFWDDGFRQRRLVEKGLGWRFGVSRRVFRARCCATEEDIREVTHGDRRSLSRLHHPHVTHEEHIVCLEHAIPPPTALGRT